MAAKKKAKLEATTKATTARAPARRKTPRKVEAGTTGLDPQACVAPATRDARAELPAQGEAREDVTELVERIQIEGGVVVGSYIEPLGGHPTVVAVLPIDKVAPTPFQRDLSETHHKRLAEVIQKTGRFLDPLIAITAPEGGFWTPNGRHRLAAMQRLGAKAITALVIPDREIAWQILALNTEKAHNLKERSLEVIRIYRGLLDEDASRPEEGFSFYLEDPALVTLGVCYEREPRFAGGAYHPILRRVEQFSSGPIREAIAVHERRAKLTLDLEAKVAAAVAKLKERGLTSPYLRSFVVARINPLRWIKGDLPPAEQVLEQMRDRAARFDISKVKQEDLARAGGAPDEEA
ncbi:MAG: ParB N-terminal domain-containing protein [Deltaproteobacteria bacterium]|nr:ParB N-terminal domain-containing protein [Deltaproteobacteria bacterium]